MIEGRPEAARCAIAEADAGPLLLGAPQSALTFFYYDDLDPAVRFYRDFIGLPLVLAEEGFALFTLNAGAQLGLIDAIRGSQRPIPGPNKGAILSLELADLDDCLARLIRAGAAGAETQLVGGCGGRTEEFRVSDPGGYTVEFFRWLSRPFPLKTV